MILEAYKKYYLLPEAIHEGALYIYSNGDPEKHPNSYAINVLKITVDQLLEIKVKFPPKACITGIPRYWAYDKIKKRLLFWPVPAQEIFAKFCYTPAIKEI